MHLAVGVFLGEQPLLQLGDQAVDVVADDFGRAGGDDRNHLDMRIAHEQHVDGGLDPVERAEHRAVVMHRGRGDLEALLEMLGDQQADEHDAALAAMDDADAVLDADRGECWAPAGWQVKIGLMVPTRSLDR